jgi:hypothetical protein
VWVWVSGGACLENRGLVDEGLHKRRLAQPERGAHPGMVERAQA